MKYRKACHRSHLLRFSIAALILCVSSIEAGAACAQNTQARRPTETVREFYKAMHEKRFREAFALSIYKPALDGLSAAEFEDLRPDFEKMATAFPEKLDISGEQISGDTANVFVKITDADNNVEDQTVGLIRDGGVWLVGSKEDREVVKKAGKQFFFEARIQAHQSDAQAMLQRISIAELAYASQHNNSYADLPTLIAAGLVPKDIETPDTTGYRFHLELAKDAKKWTAGAEPAQYGRTGRLSFALDQNGIRSGDKGGKPLPPPEKEP